MKKYITKYSGTLVIALALFSMQSCDKNFDTLNVNPDASSTIVPSYVFSKAEYDGVGNMLDFLLGTMQYTTSYNDVAGFGSKYVTSQIGQTYAAY